MADVQLKHGHTRIADALLEALLRTPLPGLHLRVVLAIIRKLYGFGKTSDRLASSQVAEIVEADPSNVRRCLRDLAEWGVITRKGGGAGRGDTPTIRLVKDFEKWKVGESEEAVRQRGKTKKRVPHTPLKKGVVDTPQEEIKRGVKRDKAGSTHPVEAGSTHPTQETRETREKSEVVKTNSKPKPKTRKTKPLTRLELAMADHFIEKLRTRHPGAKIHRAPWARAIAKIQATDREKVETIDWLFSTKNSSRDYPYVVHSGVSLAEKWSRIREAMGKAIKPKPTQRKVKPPKQETPTPATPEEVKQRHIEQISELEAMVAAGTAKPFHVNRLQSLKAGGST